MAKPQLRLGEVLKKKGITKYKYAKRLKVNYDTVFQYFRPDFNPTFKTMVKLAGAVPCKVRDLIKE